MADNHRTATKVGKSFFKCPQSVNVQVVGGFVQQQQVATGSQQLRHVDTVAFSTGKVPDKLLLILTLEVKAVRNRIRA